MSKAMKDSSNGELTRELRVVIIGAGIAGLTAAVALRQAGISTTIYERSSFAAETGAALALAPNGAKVLDSLGFDWTRARAVEVEIWETVHGKTLERYNAVDLRNAKATWGAPMRTVHRVDLHRELLRLAGLSEAGESGDAVETVDGQGPKVELKLGQALVSVDAEKGVLTLSNGETVEADLIVAADGVHSVARKCVLGEASVAKKKTDMSAFRFLLPTEVLENDPVGSQLLKTKVRGARIIADTDEKVKERHMVWYDCRGGDVQNFVGIHPTRDDENANVKESMMDEFSHFKPELLRAIELGQDISCWPLISHAALDKYVYGKLILIGDAAHPMLPFSGQGSNVAMEDGAALGYLLKNIKCVNDVPERLKIWESVRRPRASFVQIQSRVRVGKEMEVFEDLKPYAVDGQKIPTTFQERVDIQNRYDTILACQDALKDTVCRSESLKGIN